MKDDAEKAISWKELYGNPYKRKLTAVMLLTDGFTVKGMLPLKGFSYHEKFPVIVKYDREFVLRWLIKMFLSKVRFVKLETLIALITEAWELWESEGRE